MKNIDELVDEAVEKRKPKKHLKVRSRIKRKSLFMIFGAVVIASSLVSGAVFSYFAEISSDLEVQVWVEYSEDLMTWEKCEDKSISVDWGSDVAVDVGEQTHSFYLRLNANASSNKDVFFTLSGDCLEPGFTCEVRNSGGSLVNYTLTPGTEEEFTFAVDVDDKVLSGTYQFICTID